MDIQYTAKARNGATSSGVLSAESLAEARQQLRDQGQFPLSLNRANVARTATPGRSLSIGRSRVTKTDLLMVTSQLSIMCRSGVDLAEALQNVAQQCSKPALKQALDDVYRDVAEGLPVSVALKKQSHLFGDAYVASVGAGEASGTLVSVLGRLADLLRNEIRLTNALRSILAYPIVLTGVSMVVVAVLILFVLPQFADVFRKVGNPPPPLTQFLLDSAELIRHQGLVLGGILAGAIIVAFQFRLTETARRYWDGFVLNAAVVRGATRSLLTGRTFRLLGAMLQSGIPLLEAIRLCRSSVRNRLFRELFDSLEHNVVNGMGIAEVLSAAPFVPSGAAQMAATAEKSGKLGEIMHSIGEFYEDDGERQLHQLVKLIEPAIIVVMGVIVAFVVLSVILPLLDISTSSS